jgi:hypothetical protein
MERAGFPSPALAYLVRAPLRRRIANGEGARERMPAETAAASTGVRDRVTYPVRPVTDHPKPLRLRTWSARSGAQILTAPALRELMESEALVFSSSQDEEASA